MSVPKKIAAAARKLSAACNALRFSEPVTHVYNPLEYAWAAHEQYISRAASGKKKVVFLGMNPGPFGMAQTGVPFGEIAAVRDWIGIDAPISKPDNEHPKRPVEGLAGLIDDALEVRADGVIDCSLRALHLDTDRAVLHLRAIIVVAVMDEDVAAQAGAVAGQGEVREGVVGERELIGSLRLD